jgi:alkanesulfonate monooxygenase SsuD/methylene tetrahydromethanopterin reductase-like flavin-dependent oxidoreductase (luciferase family)
LIVSILPTLAYRSPQEFPAGWPTPPAYYDRDIGRQNFHEGYERIEFADELGYDWISFSEHHYTPTILAPNAAMVAAAMINRTHRAKLACLGHTLPLNNPVRVAEELALLDNLSEGRLIAGLLRGTPNEFQTFSVNPAETRERALESMELILKAWTEPQPFSWLGRHYDYRTVSVWPRPLQQPYPPTYVLGSSKESAEFAAAHHLGIGVSFVPIHVLSQLFSYYREKCAEAGWEPKPKDMLYRAGVCIAETDEQAQQDANRYWMRGGNFNLKPNVYAAIAGGDGNPLRPLAAAGGLYFASFIGGPDTVFNKIKQFRDECGVGVVDVIVQTLRGGQAKVLHDMEFFAKEVMPRAKEL